MPEKRDTDLGLILTVFSYFSLFPLDRLAFL